MQKMAARWRWIQSAGQWHRGGGGAAPDACPWTGGQSTAQNPGRGRSLDRPSSAPSLENENQFENGGGA